jgi:hypothetical protein
MKKTTIITGLLLSSLLNAQTITKDPNLVEGSINTGYVVEGGGVLVSEPSDTGTIEPGSVHCGSGGIHADNSYWRSFDLDGLGQIEVTDVDIGFESVTAGSGGTQPIIIRLYSIANGDDLPGATLTLVTEVQTTVDDAAAGTVANFPIDGNLDAATDDLVLEVFTPDGDAESNGLFIGSNASAQNRETFLTAEACGITDPTPVSGIGFPDMHVIMVVNGLANVPVDLMNFSIE